MKWKKKCKNCKNEGACSECKSEQGCSECKKYQDRAFELEVDEELQQERLAKWWKKYSWLVYGGVAAVLLTTAGFEWHSSHRMQVRLNESDAFEEASFLMYNGKNEEALTAFTKLSQNAKTGYRVLALMNISSLQMAMNQKTEALASLKEVLNTTSETDPLHLTAVLSYVGYQLEEGKPDELLKVLEPALQDKAFQGLATELAVPLLKKQGQLQKASELIQSALLNPMTSSGSKSRLNALKGE